MTGSQRSNARTSDWRRRPPEVSVVMPCYNEEQCLPTTAPALANAFLTAGIAVEVVLVDNGSRDRTGAIIDELIEAGYPITKVTIAVNRGYGDGIVRGLEACRAPIIGYLCADGQVSPEDAVMSYRLMAGREERVLTKVRRRFRRDNYKRKIVSIIYNGLMLGTFGWLGAIDINGSPKFFSRKRFEDMRLQSTDWFLDPELILKAKGLGMRVIEVDVEGHARHGGASHVKRQTMVEFLKNIWRYRFGGELAKWRRTLKEPVQARVSAPDQSLPSSADAAGAFDGVRVLEQRRFEDHRGYLQKVLAASQCGDMGVPGGEVYVTAARPGEVKGNHYHRRMGEWFAVVEGDGMLEVCDPRTGEHRSYPISSSSARTVYVPAGLAHAVVNRGESMLICIAWAEVEHDPTDVFPFTVATGSVHRELTAVAG